MNGPEQDSSAPLIASGGERMLTRQVYARLRESILSAEIKPNTRLVESELAVWLRVSRTPVREALLRLEQEGFVVHGRGWVVREYEPEEIRSRLECRLALEGYAARLASQRRNDEQLAALRSLLDSMAAPGIERLAFNGLNERFHGTITEAADNSTLLGLHAQTRMHYWDLSFPVVFSAEDDRIVRGQHLALLAALESGDGDSAEAVAREHVRHTLDIIIAELSVRYRDFRA